MPRVGAGLHGIRERREASIERGAAFGVEIGEYRGVIRSRGGSSNGDGRPGL